MFFCSSLQIHTFTVSLQAAVSVALRLSETPRNISDARLSSTVMLRCTIDTSNSPPGQVQIRRFACRGLNLYPQVVMVQWAKDGTMLGYERSIPGFPRYQMIGNDSHSEYHLRIENVSVNVYTAIITQIHCHRCVWKMMVSTSAKYCRSTITARNRNAPAPLYASSVRTRANNAHRLPLSCDSKGTSSINTFARARHPRAEIKTRSVPLFASFGTLALLREAA